MRTTGAAVLTIALVGCPGSHGIGDVPGDTRLNALNEDQWASVCAWRASLRGAEPLEYWCDGTTPISERCDHPGCNFYQLDASVCQRYGLLVFPRRPRCTATVADYQRCVTAQVERICWYQNPPPASECEALSLCEEP